MSRHDAVLKRAVKFAKGINGELIMDLYDALLEEITAHDKTRVERDTGSQQIASLLGNVRGLESKVERLQGELAHREAVFSDGGATSYHEGYLAGLVAAKAAIETLEKT